MSRLKKYTLKGWKWMGDVIGYVEYQDGVYPYVDKDENGYRIAFESVGNVGVYQWVGEKVCKEVNPLQKVWNTEGESFPITKNALESKRLTMEKQDEFGMNKYGKPLDHRMNYNWRQMIREELADADKYLQCEELRNEEIVSLLEKALELLKK
jgi:hypothetical protein